MGPGPAPWHPVWCHGARHAVVERRAGATRRQGGLHLGQMQVTRDKDRVKRSVVLPVCAYLLLVRLYGQDESLSRPWSLFRLKQRFMVDMANAQCNRIEARWQRKVLKLKQVA